MVEVAEETGGTSSSEEVRLSFMQTIRLILTNKPFFSMCLGMTGLYYVLTGIQFWASDYFIREMGTDK